ncbi:MAG: phosphonate C-P lyase system protein PhnG, partial [Pseudomonadota bacterium]
GSCAVLAANHREEIDAGGGDLPAFGFALFGDAARARQAAVVDALGHDPKHRAVLEDTLIGPVTRRVAEERETERRKVAATRVNFFTMVRGEDGA